MNENKLILVLEGEGIGRGIVSFCFPSNTNVRFKRYIKISNAKAPHMLNSVIRNTDAQIKCASAQAGQSPCFLAT